MNTFRQSTLAVLTALTLTSASVWAQEDLLPLPSEQQSGAATYVTGGTAYEQIPAFKQARSSYPLNIELYEKAGARDQFTADVEVKLTDKAGNVVLQAKTEGPYLWVKVPPGQYKMQATLNGKMLERRVSVNHTGSTRAVLVFPQGTD